MVFALEPTPPANATIISTTFCSAEQILFLGAYQILRVSLSGLYGVATYMNRGAPFIRLPHNDGGGGSQFVGESDLCCLKRTIE